MKRKKVVFVTMMVVCATMFNSNTLTCLLYTSLRLQKR